MPGGHGLARHEEGRVLLVPGGLPGDRVLVHREDRRAGAARATEWRLSKPSPDRIEPICEVHAHCGGCDLMGLERQAQERAKVGLLKDALMRTAGLSEAELDGLTMTSAPQSFAYRNRLRLQIDAGGRIGFYRKGSRELVQPKRCHVAVPEIDRVLARLRKLTRRHPKALGGFAFVEVRVSTSSTSLYFELKPQVSWVPVESTALLATLAQDFLVRTSADRAPQRYERFDLSERSYLYAVPGGFTQVNWAVNRLLVERVVGLASTAGSTDFIDLYSGSGNFSIPLLAAGLTGVGVEANAAAVAAASLAAREQKLPGRFVSGDALEYAKQAARRGAKFELVLLDPPRSGIKQGLEHVAALAPSHLALISCDPVTFARDLRGLLALGFCIQHLEAFDMFPQTHHLESLAWLKRAA